MSKESEEYFGQFVITKVVREHIPVKKSTADGLSYGALLDKHIAELAANRVLTKSITIEFEEDEWERLCQ